jgi:hypothetical protein
LAYDTLFATTSDVLSAYFFFIKKVGVDDAPFKKEKIAGLDM